MHNIYIYMYFVNKKLSNWEVVHTLKHRKIGEILRNNIIFIAEYWIRSVDCINVNFLSLML